MVLVKKFNFSDDFSTWKMMIYLLYCCLIFNNIMKYIIYYMIWEEYGQIYWFKI